MYLYTYVPECVCVPAIVHLIVRVVHTVGWALFATYFFIKGSRSNSDVYTYCDHESSHYKILVNFRDDEIEKFADQKTDFSGKSFILAINLILKKYQKYVPIKSFIVYSITALKPVSVCLFSLHANKCFTVYHVVRQNDHRWR